MASLVQGVSVLERDRQWNRQGPDARAPAWWRFFHFELRRVLVDAADGSIFGAVYAFQPPFHLLDPTAAASAPHYVVAFRGTITKKGSAKRDLELDLQLVRNGLEGKSRFRVAMQAIHDTVAAAAGQHDRVWLAGHSLGSAIATLAAKTLARAGAAVLPTFLFNAPFLSAPVERIGDRRVRQGIRIASSFVTAGVAAVLQRGGGGGVGAEPVREPGGPHQRGVRGVLRPPQEDGGHRGRRRGEAGDEELGQGPAARHRQGGRRVRAAAPVPVGRADGEPRALAGLQDGARDPSVVAARPGARVHRALLHLILIGHDERSRIGRCRRLRLVLPNQIDGRSPVVCMVAVRR